QHGADLVFLEVERDAKYIVGKRQHFAGHDLFQAVDAGDAVAHADDRADFLDRNGLLVIFYLLAQNLADFVCLDVRHSCPSFLSIPETRASGWTWLSETVLPSRQRAGPLRRTIRRRAARAAHLSACATTRRKSCRPREPSLRPANGCRARTWPRLSYP